MSLEVQVKEILATIKYPGYSKDIVSFGLLKEVRKTGSGVHVQIQLTTPNVPVAQQIRTECQQALKARGIEAEVEVLVPDSRQSPAPGATFGQQNAIPGVKKLIAVASGKGGVGKSTVSANLACALRHLGSQVGLLDCDIYGPSIPLIMGLNQRPTINDSEKLVPPNQHGIKLMSMGFLVEGDTPVIWRGPMIMKTIQQFVHQVEWGELDYLLVDLPPGTGDAQLSLCQTVPLDGGVIVTTPQEASVSIVRKGIAMFQKVNVPILGLVENMSYYTTPTGERVEIFGHGGGRKEAGRQHIPFLGEIPLFPDIRAAGDNGVPVVVSDVGGAPAQAFLNIASNLKNILTGRG